MMSYTTHYAGTYHTDFYTDCISYVEISIKITLRCVVVACLFIYFFCLRACQFWELGFFISSLANLINVFSGQQEISDRLQTSCACDTN